LVLVFMNQTHSNITTPHHIILHIHLFLFNVLKPRRRKQPAAGLGAGAFH
jgi:hypothetical protein